MIFARYRFQVEIVVPFETAVSVVARLDQSPLETALRTNIDDLFYPQFEHLNEITNLNRNYTKKRKEIDRSPSIGTARNYKL